MFKLLEALSKKNKFIPLLVIGLIALLAVLVVFNLNNKQDFRSRAAGSETIELSMVAPQNVQINDEFTVELYANGTSMSGISSCLQPQNGGTLQVLSISSTGIFPTLLLPGSVTNNKACIVVGSSATSPVSGKVKYAEVRVRATAAGTSAMNFADVEAYDINHPNNNLGSLQSVTTVVGGLVQNPITLSTQVSSASANVNNNVDANIVLNSPHRVTAGVFCLNYNPAVLQGVSIQPDGSNWIVLENGTFNNGKACITLGVQPTEGADQGVTGSSVQTARFTFKAIASGISSLICDSATDLAAIGFGANDNLVGQCTGSSVLVASGTGPTSIPPTSAQPTSVQPTSVIPTSVVPTSVQPTSIVPTSTNPTTIPNPTSVLPTGGSCSSNSQCQVQCVVGTNCPIGRCVNGQCTYVIPTSGPSPTPRPTVAAGACIGNITGPGSALDNTTDLLDFNLLVEVWSNDNLNSIIDFDGDGEVTIADYNEFITDFGCVEAED